MLTLGLRRGRDEERQVAGGAGVSRGHLMEGVWATLGEGERRKNDEVYARFLSFLGLMQPGHEGQGGIEHPSVKQATLVRRDTLIWPRRDGPECTPLRHAKPSHTTVKPGPGPGRWCIYTQLGFAASCSGLTFWELQWLKERGGSFNQTPLT